MIKYINLLIISIILTACSVSGGKFKTDNIEKDPITKGFSKSEIQLSTEFYKFNQPEYLYIKDAIREEFSFGKFPLITTSMYKTKDISKTKEYTLKVHFRGEANPSFFKFFILCLSGGIVSLSENYDLSIEATLYHKDKIVDTYSKKVNYYYRRNLFTEYNKTVHIQYIRQFSRESLNFMKPKII